MAREGLRYELASALRQAANVRAEVVRQGICLSSGDQLIDLRSTETANIFLDNDLKIKILLPTIRSLGNHTTTPGKVLLAMEDVTDRFRSHPTPPAAAGNP